MLLVLAQKVPWPDLLTSRIIASMVHLGSGSETVEAVSLPGEHAACGPVLAIGL